MQNLITKNQKLLNEFGHLSNPGYAFHPVFEYSRKDIKASIWRIKEWDYYAVLNQRHGITFTIADLGYSAMVTVVTLDFEHPQKRNKTKLLWFPFGKMNLPKSSLDGDSVYSSNDLKLEFIRHKNSRTIRAYVKGFENGNDLDVHLELDDLHDESMVIATPWKENKLSFYYNQKINCMPTSGTMKLGEKTITFDKSETYAVLDWGRGVWTYKNTWYWSSLSGVVNGKRFGFNLGYGFGDTSAATENMLFFDGKAHKLDKITFEINHSNLMNDWIIKDNQNRVDLIMKPVLDRPDQINLGIIKNIGHQIFGLFSGSVILDDGSKLIIENLLGFAEKIMNHY
ncbi:MAG: DUF2804 domain-containing protein [Firmicutes bacterium]|nr:DUF2804 domain-containing protein [Bacillota bacterium]